MQQLVKAAQQQSLPINIVGIISDQPDAPGLVWAKARGLATYPLNAEKALMPQLSHCLDQLQPDWILLAGFMRILSAEFVQQWHGKIINIHPALLPKFPGLNTHQQALDQRESEHGASVHFVVPEVDAGPVIMHAKLSIQPDHDAQSLASDVLALEHQLYPQAIRYVLEQNIQLHDAKTLSIEGRLVSQPQLLNA